MSGQGSQNLARRAGCAWVLVLGIFVLGAAWTGAWYWAAGKLDEGFVNAKTNLERDGGAVDCANREVTGFPFRIGVQCAKVELAQPGGGKVSAGALRSAAQLYNPGHAVAELDGPLQFEIANGEAVVANWTNLRASIKVGLQSLDQFSAEVKQADIALPASAGWARSVRSENAQFHLRDAPDGENAVEVAVSADGLQLQPIPIFSLFARVSGNGLKGQLSPKFNLDRHLRQNGLEGVVGELSAAPGAGGKLSVSGPFEVTRDGVLSGEFTISVSGLRELLSFAREAAPQEEKLQETLSQSAVVVETLPQDASGKRLFKIRVRDGKASLGFIPLGEIPPLWR